MKSSKGLLKLIIVGIVLLLAVILITVYINTRCNGYSDLNTELNQFIGIPTETGEIHLGNSFDEDNEFFDYIDTINGIKYYKQINGLYHVGVVQVNDTSYIKVIGSMSYGLVLSNDLYIGMSINELDDNLNGYSKIYRGKKNYEYISNDDRVKVSIVLDKNNCIKKIDYILNERNTNE